MQQKVTVYDIAEDLGISVSTVSRVLNNSSLIGDSRREQILARAAELGYRKKPVRRPAKRAILTIGLFLPTTPTGHLHLFYDPSQLIDAVQTGFAETKTNVVSLLNRPGSESVFARKKLADFDGCIFAFTAPDEPLREELARRGIPFVLVNRVDERTSYVCLDNRQGMELLVDAWQRSPFADTQSGAIAFMDVSPARAVADERRRGLENALDRRGVARRTVRHVVRDSLAKLSTTTVGGLVEAGVRWICCVNDVSAVYVYNCLVELGLRPGRDVGLSGFDNSPVRALAATSIPSIELGVVEMGKNAAEWLRERIIARVEERLRLTLPPRFIPGETLGEPRSGGSRDAVEEGEET